MARMSQRLGGEAGAGAWVHAQPLIPNVLELVASGRMDPDRIHTIAGWDDAIDAICEVPVKLVLVRD